MRTLFLLNPAAGKQDCTAQLIPQIEAAARRAGLAPEEVTIHVTEYAGHAREHADRGAFPDGELRLHERSAGYAREGCVKHRGTHPHLYAEELPVQDRAHHPVVARSLRGPLCAVRADAGCLPRRPELPRVAGGQAGRARRVGAPAARAAGGGAVRVVRRLHSVGRAAVPQPVQHRDPQHHPPVPGDSKCGGVRGSFRRQTAMSTRTERMSLWCTT